MCLVSLVAIIEEMYLQIRKACTLKREQKMKESAIDLGTEITALSMSSTNDQGYRESMNGTYGNW